MAGVIRTRVGYSGGTSTNPTYHDLEQHSETIEITYDPARISYGELLDVFWENHNPVNPSPSRQYQSFIFTHDEEQLAAATASKSAREGLLKSALYTGISPAGAFYPAEDYHQKYYLGAIPGVKRELQELYPVFADYTASTAVARLNGYAGDFIQPGQLVAELSDLGFERDTIAGILEAAGENVAAYCPAPTAGS